MRMTRQREVILQELRQSCQHLTADDLYDLVRLKEPKISLATVYRNLELLAENGFIGKIALGGRQKVFDADPTDHHHITCYLCSRVDNLEGLHDMSDLLRNVDGGDYTITASRLEVVGICPSCLEKTNNSE